MKRWLALFLAMVLCLSCLPLTPAQALEAEEQIPVLPVEEVYRPELISIPQSVILSTGADTEDLFAQYVDSVFYPSDVKALGTEAGDRLSGDLRKLYDGICWLFKEVASGRRSSTEIRIGKGEEYDVTLSGTMPTNEEITILMSAFLSDLAYEQYWFDKTSGFWYSGGSSFYFGFIVAENYRGIDEFHTNTAITGAATKSAANARQIVANLATKSDYTKLVKYSDTICDLVEYDYDAAGRGNFAQCNDPWQMIYAFDYDPTTNIVCEGYSKAYKYLCDQSDFSNEVSCYTVTGSTGGPHMWNIVSINGQNYLTDVTNVDGGWDLLLAGGSGSIDTYYKVNGLYYYYDYETLALWGADSDSILNLESKDYEPSLNSIADCAISTIDSVIYTGDPIVPPVTVTTADGKVLTENVHYTLAYKNNTGIGKASITITGIDAYSGKVTKKFTILPAQVQNLRLEGCTATTAKIKFDAVPGAGTYRISVDGKVKASTESTSYTVKGLKLGQEYKITVEAGKKSGDTTYYGKASEGLIVVPSSSLSGYKVSLQYSSTIHDGSAKMPTVKVTKDKKALVQDRDYTVSYENNIAVGKATVTVTGMGSYNGTLTKTFTINPGKVTGLTCEAAGPTSLAISFDAVPGAKFYKVYAGGKLKATVSETTCVLTELKAGTTYKITVKAGAEAGGTEFLGSASAAVSGKPAYDITKCNASLAYESVAYNGKTRKPAVTVLSETGSKLKKDTHYTVSYKANKAVGLATVTVKGKGAYTGTVTLTFEIVPGKVSTPTFSSVTGNSAVVKWKKASGAAWYRIWVNGEPLDITSSLSYTLTGLEAGRTYTIEVHGGKTVGDEDYCGVLAKAELTPTWDLSKYTVKLDSDKVTYTGEAVVPAVTVTDENGNVLKLDEDFTVTCKNNTKIGKASLTVKGTGKYRGSITKSFQIVPAQVQNIQVTSATKKSLKISFDKVPSASTYRIYVNGKLKGTTSKTSFTIQKLKAGTEYQITVQAGKKVGKTTFYGAMSDIFTAATKP